MRARLALVIGAITVLVSACAPNPGAPATTETTGPPGSLAETSIARCDDVPELSAPEEWYRDSPIYVANEQPTEEIRAWAVTQPGFEEIWVDREHLGWIAVAFSADAEARQADLERLFPEIGVVAIEVDWTMAEMHALQQRVSDELGPLFGPSSGIMVMQGVVSIGVGVLKEDRIAAIEERFAGEPICIEGVEPEDAPADGPQPGGGDGWRLLADEQDRGEAYRTWIATDVASYLDLWDQIGLQGAPPPVDFESEVVIWFGAVYGSSCPDLRLDDVVTDLERAIVHAEIVLVDAPMACTGDANPHAYVVALDRARLPVGRFAIQLGSDDPPPGFPGERIFVDVDLTHPGSVASPDDLRSDAGEPERVVLESGMILEPGFDFAYRFDVRCGIEWLGELNEVAWVADSVDDDDAPIPDRWPEPDGDGTIEVSILLQPGPDPIIEATANGHTITYRPSPDELPTCD